MPKYLSAGYSADTEEKQRQYRVVLGTLLGCWGGIQPRNGWVDPRFLYIDLNAGPGMVDGQKGSPLIFLELANAKRIPFDAFFFERDQRSRDLLTVAIRQWEQVQDQLYGNYHILGDHHADFDGVLAYSRQTLTPGTTYLGMAYADPNGTDVPWDVLHTLNRTYRRVDQLVNVTATAIKRANGAFGRTVTLEDRLYGVGKRYITVREPFRSAHQWTMAILTEWDNFPRFERLGFHRVDSPEGQAILRKLTLTRDQLRQQGESLAGQQLSLIRER